MRGTLILVALLLLSPAVGVRAEEIGEARLFVKMVWTASVNQQLGSDSSLKTIDEHVTAVSVGSAVFRIREWFPTLVHETYSGTLDGGGVMQWVTEGLDDHHPPHPFTRTTTERWTFEPPSAQVKLSPQMSRAGAAVVVPGTWTVILGVPNSVDLRVRGTSRSESRGCPSFSSPPTGYSFDTANAGYSFERPRSARAHHLLRTAYDQTLGSRSNDGMVVTGTWDAREDGFTVSGELARQGGEPGAEWSVQIEWELSFARDPSDTEVTVEAPTDYDGWEPLGTVGDPEVAGNSITLRVRAHKRGDRESPPEKNVTVAFSFASVSHQPGVCINWPPPAVEVIGDGLRFLQSENGHLEVPDNQHAKTRGAVTETEVTVSSFDYGAWGRLQIDAHDEDGRRVPVTFQGRVAHDVPIPKDDDGNYIADVWQERHGVTGYDARWDEAAVEGQSTSGDGLSLYEKYRGVVHLAGSDMKWQRLPPREKTLFVVDGNGIFDTEAWWKASAIRAYRVRDDMVKRVSGDERSSRLLNHARSAAGLSNGEKFAVVLTSVPTGDTEDLVATGGAFQIGETEGAVPRNVAYCIVFPDRVRAGLLLMKNRLERAVSNYESSPGHFAQNYPKWLLQRAVESLQSPAVFESLFVQQLRWAALHEIGHACGIDGHIVEDEESDAGNAACLMRYTSHPDNRRNILLQTLLNPDSTLPTVDRGLAPASDFIFCRDADFDCFSKLDVKDN